MAISGVNPKCYILALFVRDDGTRFLLGDDPFEFKDNQLHFQQNTMANDVVEVQGNDGYLLAGQVRRPGTQMFDGYVCNGTNSKEEVEVKRRSFLQFFRRSHFYKVIYVFPNGTAIQRKQGFLVDDPTVQELYQQYPEYHVALNFEDVNYYTYEEDDQGHEIYAKEAIVALARGGATGGLIWDSYGVVWEDAWSLPLSISGVQFQILNNAGVRAPIENVELCGDTYQQTYSGYNLIDLVPMTKEQPSYYQQCSIETVADSTLGRNVLHITGTNNFPSVVYQLTQRLESGKYYVLKFTYRSTINNTATRPDLWFAPNWSGNNWDVLSSITNGRMKPGDGDTRYVTPQSTNWKTTSRKFYVDPSQYSSVDTSYSRICFSLGYNSDSGGFEGKEIWLADAELYEITEDEWNADTYTSKDYEPYTGGIPAPNPDYPQEIDVVTGEQTVEVHGKNLFNPVAMANASYRLESDGAISIGAAYTVEGRRYFNSIALKAGTYTLSFIPTTEAPQGLRYSIRDIDSSTDIVNESRNFVNGERQAYTFTLTQDYQNIGICLVMARRTEAGQRMYLYDIQLEPDSTATAYQPYHDQSYIIDLRGKNILNISDFAMGGLSNGNPTTSNYRIQNANHPIAVQPNTTYTLSAQLVSPVQGFRVGIHEIGKDGGFLRDLGWQQIGTAPFTLTTDSDTYFLKMVGSLSTTSTNVTTGGTENTTSCSTVTEFMRGCTLQFELGNTATAYVPYSPIELCKIGDYQDYIYKSGGDWYVHKECGKVVFDGTEAWNGGTSTGSPTYLYAYTVALDSLNLYSARQAFCSHFTIAPNQLATGTEVSYPCMSVVTPSAGTYAHIRLMIPLAIAANTNALRTWLGSHNTNLYYVLATASDTQITDATLIGQLEALDATRLSIGENNVLVSTPEPNLPATLSFDYYTKFATIGAEWEEGGTKGATIVNVDAIDNTYPVWELTGPATNPTLSVLTTNTTLTYNGTITASQKLVIDMFNKTATLNGTSVIGNISGDFVYMAPGTNRVAYTAGNTDAPDSTIYWQEVVG